MERKVCVLINACGDLPFEVPSSSKYSVEIIIIIRMPHNIQKVFACRQILRMVTASIVMRWVAVKFQLCLLRRILTFIL